MPLRPNGESKNIIDKPFKNHCVERVVTTAIQECEDVDQYKSCFPREIVRSHGSEAAVPGRTQVDIEKIVVLRSDAESEHDPKSRLALQRDRLSFAHGNGSRSNQRRRIARPVGRTAEVSLTCPGCNPV
jgi:hypothetical protein